MRIVKAIGLLGLSAIAAFGGDHILRSPQMAVTLSDNGEIKAVQLAPEPRVRLRRAVLGRTTVGECKVLRTVASKRGGGLEFSHALACGEGRAATLTERFLTGRQGSIRWEIEVLGSGEPWSAPIETALSWPADTGTRFWTTWGDTRPQEERKAGDTTWTDPLVPLPLQNRTFLYGGLSYEDQDSFSVPIATILEPKSGAGLSLVQSPEDTMIELRLKTTTQGTVAFSRTNRRIGKDHPVRFAVDLVPHAADWRGGLGWMRARYPEYFDPPNPRTHEIAGVGAYSEYEGELDTYKFLSMGFNVNWKASYDYYYMGMMLPPVSDEETWVNARTSTGTPKYPTSIRHVREYSEQMRRLGFQVLNYFNVQEYGLDIQATPPPRKAARDEDLWRDANDFIHYQMKDAILRTPEGKMMGAWEGGVLLDHGEPVLRSFLEAQVKRHLDNLPASAGICIDRMDFLRLYNVHRDDGVSWKDGAPARSEAVSWLTLLDRLGGLVHGAGKVVYSNPLYDRLDLMRQLDGFYDELGWIPHKGNRSAFLALNKPCIVWTTTTNNPDPDSYFQRHLYLGQYVTAPFPVNNHAIPPSGASIDKQYLDYGPLFDALRGRSWVLTPGVLQVEGGQAKANVFAVPGGYVVPVTFGSARGSVTIRLHGLDRIPGQQDFFIETISPGRRDWTNLRARAEREDLILDVPLVRGCALVRLAYARMKPEARAFLEEAQVRLDTTVRDATVHYTLDGSQPDAGSPVYAGPLKLADSRMVRAVVLQNGKPAGKVLSREFIKAALPAPALEPAHATFETETRVALLSLPDIEGAIVRYTLDGSEPSESSARYAGPLTLTSSTTLRARTFLKGARPSPLAEGTYSRLPAAVRAPEVHLADLTQLRAAGCSSKIKLDKSMGDTPLSIAGRKFERGVGVCCPTELAYELKPTYRRFVAVVGVDDAVENASQALMTQGRFLVYADEHLIAESPMLHLGEHWPLEAAIPAGSRELRLVATGGNCFDRLDWANAGFLSGPAGAE
jgi:hypothetical protein